MKPDLLKYLSLAVAVAVNPPFAAPSAPSAPPAPFAVLELFTSEGCSSCPPADKLLSDLASEAEAAGKPVYALSFHVDYWNYLGWADPFSRAEFTGRQQRYAQIQGGRVYTPQLIVNGGEAFVGSQGATARRSIEAALEQSAGAAIALRPVRNGDGGITVEYAVTGQLDGDLLNLALAEKGVSVRVKRGENGGRILKHENVVRAFRTVRLDAAGKGSVELKAPSSVPAGRGLIIAYAQRSGTLRTLGAARAGL